MPRYEYKCTNCAAELELQQGINEAPKITCDECNTDGLERLISKTSFALKGTGWYTTDYKGK